MGCLMSVPWWMASFTNISFESTIVVTIKLQYTIIAPRAQQFKDHNMFTVVVPGLGMIPQGIGLALYNSSQSTSRYSPRTQNCHLNQPLWPSNGKTPSTCPVPNNLKIILPGFECLGIIFKVFLFPYFSNDILQLDLARIGMISEWQSERTTILPLNFPSYRNSLVFLLGCR